MRHLTVFEGADRSERRLIGMKILNMSSRLFIYPRSPPIVRPPVPLPSGTGGKQLTFEDIKTIKPECDCNLIDLTDSKGRWHILEGDGPDKGGGHRYETGKSSKSEFPADWSDAKILHEIYDIATDPTVHWSKPNSFGYISGSKVVDGVVVKVVVDTKTGRIVTGYPPSTLKIHE